MVDKQKVVKNTPPAVKVEGFVKVTIKGRTETLTIGEAEQLKSQLSCVLKERKEYITVPSTPVTYPWYFGCINEIKDTCWNTGLDVDTLDNGKTMSFGQGDTVKVGDLSLTFLKPEEAASKKPV